MSDKEELRQICFQPYLLGPAETHPIFDLRTWVDGRSDNRGSETIIYELSIRGVEGVLFSGDDYHGSPLHGSDSDENMAGLMGFLTLCPGDTDDEYFEKYTPTQLEYCEQFAESLSMEVGEVLGEY